MTEDEEEEWRSPAESREQSSPFQNEVDHWSDFIRLLLFFHCSALPSALHLQHRFSIKTVYNFPCGYVKALHYFEIDPSRGTVKPFPTSTLKIIKKISRKRRQHVALIACIAAEVWILSKADNFTLLLFINKLWLRTNKINYKVLLYSDKEFISHMNLFIRHLIYILLSKVQKQIVRTQLPTCSDWQKQCSLCKDDGQVIKKSYGIMSNALWPQS